MNRTAVTTLLLVFCFTFSLSAQQHPKLILTQSGVEAIRSNLGKVPLFDSTLERVKQEVDAEILLGIDLPVPADYSGGYTHERHKRNYLIMQKAGVLFQVLQDEKYAVYVKDMLFGYAEMYPNLPPHPKTRSYARGKIFWQCLNDSNWLVYASQAYDCIYEWLTAEERKHLEHDLFKPFANFISIENPQFFNRIHNHSTWGNVAVGMIALVMNDQELLDRALYGIPGDQTGVGLKDDDGGFIKSESQKAGFFANLEEPFSPDGYYTEGPYYQRYAMYPFLIFAQALEQNRPELNVFDYKEGVLIKSVYALLNLTDGDGEFFPLNDAQKGMSYFSRELVSAVDIAYYFGGQDPQLLSIAREQGRVALNDTGFSVALGLTANLEVPFEKSSVILSDGPNGEQGGIAILRKKDTELVFKYSAQGLSHGHYDKLSFSLYEEGEEVLQDYGLARFVNIEQKGGGNYLPENKTWAKQTIAHNTIVLDRKSHFEGKYELGSKYHSEPFYFDINSPELIVASAMERNAYPGSTIHRTIALITDSIFIRPAVLDLTRVVSREDHLMELPYYYLGQPIQASFNYTTSSEPEPMGEKFGYQHLYEEAQGPANKNTSAFTWLNHNRFYTISLLTNSKDELVFGRIGAHDPEFNLRRDPVLIQRKIKQRNAVFAAVVESHGNYSPVSEIASNAYSNIKSLERLSCKPDYTAVKLTPKNGAPRIFIINHSNEAENAKHEILAGGKPFLWEGPVYYGKY